jgi:HK97 family phage prohead protease
MTKRTGQPPETGVRLLAFTGGSYDAKTRTAEVVITTSTPVKRWGMIEILEVSDKAVDLSRVGLGQVKLLDSHNSGSVECVLGVLESARIESPAVVGVVRFGETEEALEAAGMVERGEITGISCGYRVLRWERTDYDAETDTETWTGTRWELFEVSLVSIPADKFAGIRSLDTLSPPAIPAVIQEPTMTDASVRQPTAEESAASTPAASAPAATETRAAPAPAPVDSGAALRADRARAAEIIAIGARHNLDTAMTSQAIADGVSLDAFRATVLETLAVRSPAAQLKPGAGTFGIVDAGESPDSRRTAMVDGIIMRAMGFAPDGTAGRPKVESAERSREFAGMSLVELAAETLGIRGAHRMPRVQLYEEVVQRSMLGTSDFPLLLSAAANKFLLAQYQYQQPSYRMFAAKKNFNDFKTHNFLKVGDFPVLEQLSETGEFRNGAISENRETVSALTYGKIVSLSRQMFVNDDLSAFSDLTSAAGRRVADFENSVAWAVVLANSKAGPTMSDTGNLFNATAVTTAGGHANQAGSATAITVAALSTARTAMRVQKSLDGIPLNIGPAMIVAGPQKQTELEQLLSTQLLATQISNINPFNGGGLTSLKPVVDAYITDNAWYLFADPMVAPTFVWGYVSGFEGPRFAIDQPFRQDGLSLKVVEDFGFGAIDWRGAFRNAGA